MDGLRPLDFGTRFEGLFAAWGPVGRGERGTERAAASRWSSGGPGAALPRSPCSHPWQPALPPPSVPPPRQPRARPGSSAGARVPSSGRGQGEPRPAAPGDRVWGPTGRWGTGGSPAGGQSPGGSGSVRHRGRGEQPGCGARPRLTCTRRGCRGAKLGHGDGEGEPWSGRLRGLVTGLVTGLLTGLVTGPVTGLVTGLTGSRWHRTVWSGPASTAGTGAHRDPCTAAASTAGTAGTGHTGTGPRRAPSGPAPSPAPSRFPRHRPARRRPVTTPPSSRPRPLR